MIGRKGKKMRLWERLWGRKQKWYWCPYHQEILLRMSEADYKQRWCTIISTKPTHELAARLNNFREVKGKLPKVLDEIWAKRMKARKAVDKALTAYLKSPFYKMGAAKKKKAQAYYEAHKKEQAVINNMNTVMHENILTIRALYEEEQPYGDWNWDKMELDFPIA